MNVADAIARLRKPSKDLIPKIARKIAQLPRRMAIAAGMNGERRVTLADGSTFVADPRRGWIDWNLAVRGTYEPGTLTLIRKFLGSGDTFVDVGANIGLMSVTAARCVGPSGQVLAFEPDSRNFPRLASARQANSVPQLLPIPLALGSHTGHITINRAPGGDGGLSSIKEIPGFIGGEQIRLTTLDAMVDALCIDQINLIKIDVEGAEEDVVMGGLKSIMRFRPVLIIEMINQSAVAAGKMLSDMGYKAFVTDGKDSFECRRLRPIEPRLLDHDNMIFVDADKCGQLADMGLQVVEWQD